MASRPFYLRVTYVGRTRADLTFEERYEAAQECAFLIDSLVLFLRTVDPAELASFDTDSVRTAFGFLAELVEALTSEILAQLEKIESERKRLIAMMPEKGGER